MLDANVLISAAIRTGGPPGLIVAALVSRRAFDLILSPAIIAEVETGLARPKVRKYLRAPGEALPWLAGLVAVGDLVQDTGEMKGASRDPKDDAVLAAAVKGRADAIVSGDDDLLALGEHQGILILTPRAFFELVEEPA